MDTSPFLNWNGAQFASESEKAVVFQSLVATVKFQPSLDDSLEAEALEFLTRMDLDNEQSADDFLHSYGHTTDESLANFVQCIVVLISSPNQSITTATMEMLGNLISRCSAEVLLALIKADLIPQLIITLTPQSHSFAEAVDIHINVMKIIVDSLWLSTPNGLRHLKIEDHNEQQAVHETVFQQVLSPSERYIWHLCANRYSIIDNEQSKNFLNLLAQLLEISSYYQPTMYFVLHTPVFLTIPSCLTFFEIDNSIVNFLYFMIEVQREWSEHSGEMRQMGKRVTRQLRMEGIEDVIEAKLRNDQKERCGGDIVSNSIAWSNLLGMNLPRRW
ncbi:hypothetical protein BLNAU_12016 [Blattamonas nauphoetae]|uniref:Uncharacterized protein n=1 Tax=Blattamonas nauphoetae TaxID=2049346 RepID=A0ABQ9XNS0_9EUKA|nr:hypothetical protein BLNAU_12016 [Blattamonas nauphoetae]